jgi:hypothetical protein
MQSEKGRRNRLVTAAAYVLVVAVIFTLPASIIAHNGIRVLFSSDALSQGISELLLQQGGLREQLVDGVFASGWLEDLKTRQDNPFQYLTSRDRLQIAQVVFPDDWINDQVQNGFEAILSWLQTDEPIPEIVLDLGPVKESLSSGGNKAIVEILVDTWSSCSREQELIMQRALQSDLPMNFEICRPGGDLYSSLIDQLVMAFRTYFNNIQSEIPFIGSDDDTNYLNNLLDLKRQLLRLSLWLRWIRLSPYPLLGLLMTLIIRSWYNLGRWWGIPLMLGSLTGLLGVWLLQGITPNFINQALIDSESQAGDIASLKVIINDIIHIIFEGAASQLFLTFLIGAGLLGIPWFIHRRQQAYESNVAEKTRGEEIVEVVSPQSEPEEQQQDVPSPPPVKPFDPEGLSTREED